MPKNHTWLTDPKTIDTRKAEYVIEGISHAVLGDRNYHDFKRSEFENPLISPINPEKQIKSPIGISRKVFFLISIGVLLATGIIVRKTLQFFNHFMLVVDPISFLCLFMAIGLTITIIVAILISR